MLQPINRNGILWAKKHKTPKRKHPSTARMNPWLLSGLILLGLTAVLAVFFTLQLSPPKPISPFMFKLIQSEAPFDHIVDVCHGLKYLDGNYPSARGIQYEYINRLPSYFPNRNESILFYCDRSDLAFRAAEAAHAMGYRHVSYLVDGDFTDM